MLMVPAPVIPRLPRSAGPEDDPRRPMIERMAQRQARVRVLVADDHPLFREAVVRAVKERPELELVAEAADGTAALTAIRDVKPDVAVLDVKMPGLDGIKVANAVARDRLPTRVVLLSPFLDGAMAFDAVAAGAAAYLSKDADRRRILDTITAVSRGETVLAPEIQGGLATEIRLRGAKDRPGLSERERQVLTLNADVKSAPEFGRVLFLSTATVK